MFVPRKCDGALLLGAATERFAFVKFIEASVFPQTYDMSARMYLALSSPSGLAG